MKPTVIAIDGPGASGKSTVARAVAQALGYVYVDTGAMYRAVAWKALENKIDPRDERSVMEMVENLKVDLKLVDGCVQMWVDGYYPEKEIRMAQTSAVVPIVAAMAPLRKWVVAHQRATAKFGNLVMEGRDIGSVVFPDAARKFYLDARPEVRAARRQKEGVPEVLEARDQHDSQRKVSPLRVARGAQVIDTSAMDVKQVVERILASVKGQEP